VAGNERIYPHGDPQARHSRCDRRLPRLRRRSLAGAQETTEDTTVTTEAPAEDKATTEDGATTEADGAEEEGCDEDDALADPSDDAPVEGSSL